MARYVASVIFADGDQIQTVATGSPDDHLTGVLRSEAVSGLRDMLSMTRIPDEEAAEVAEALDRLDDE